jgi:hypothetical protein
MKTHPQPPEKRIGVRGAHSSGNTHRIEACRYRNRLEFGRRHPDAAIMAYFVGFGRASNPPRFGLVSRAGQGRLFGDVLGI